MANDPSEYYNNLPLEQRAKLSPMIRDTVLRTLKAAHMTKPQITREEIEARIARLENSISRRKTLLTDDDSELRHSAKQFIKHDEKELAILTLALVGQAVQPRSIKDAPKDGTKFLAFQKTSEGWEHYDCWWHQGPKDEQYWMDVSDSEPEPTHFIPLTSLPEPKI